jgi:hypothetical protein
MVDTARRIRHSYRTTLCWLIAAILLRQTHGNACPKRCSGHGSCQTPSVIIDTTLSDNAIESAGICQCDTGWVGPECGRAACPTGIAWFDAATSDGVAHLSSAECSGVGTCDYFDGTCICPLWTTGK